MDMAKETYDESRLIARSSTMTLYRTLQEKGMEHLLKDGNSLLDIGCGYGLCLDYLSHINPRLDLWGVDVRVYNGMTSGVIKKNPSIKFLQADFQALPFRSNSFDMVFSSCILDYYLWGYQRPFDIEKMAKEVDRVLKDRGAYFIYDINIMHGPFDAVIPPSPKLAALDAFFERKVRYLFVKKNTESGGAESIDTLLKKAA